MIKNISTFNLILIIFMISCDQRTETNLYQLEKMNLLKNIPQTQWDTLASKKIYFGHQSVGFNIMDGVKMHLKDNPNIGLHIAEGQSPDIFTTTVFAHDRNGKNGDPKSKIDAFCNAVESGLGNSIDMAGFKFCYVDFKKGTDVNDVFQYYKFKMKALQLKYPNLQIVHFTVPIRSLQKGPKGLINKILGREIGVSDNSVRQKFNDLLLNEFKGQPVFNIAQFESTFPDGSRCFTEVAGEKIYSMVPAYTYDSGHLSDKGKFIVSAHLLTFLAEQSNAGNH
jgi:hypothetical protein